MINSSWLNLKLNHITWLKLTKSVNHNLSCFTSSTISGAALPAWVWRWWWLPCGLGAAQYLVNLCCLLPRMFFKKPLICLSISNKTKIGISLWRSMVGISIALVAGLAAGLIAGSFKTAMALLKPVITILLAMPPIIWVVMALFWFGFGNPSVLLPLSY